MQIITLWGSSIVVNFEQPQNISVNLYQLPEEMFHKTSLVW